MELSSREKMDSKDESSHVWPTSTEHEQSATQVKGGLLQLVIESSVSAKEITAPVW